MPAKIIVCDICKKEVSKRQSVSVGDGKRACREHEGVNLQAQAAQTALKSKYDAAKDKWRKEQEKWRKQRTYSPPKELNLEPKCFACRGIGIHSREFFLTMLICQEKFELTYQREFRMFDPADAKLAYGVLQGKQCLWTHEYDPEKMKLCHSARGAAQMLGFCLLCTPCCTRFGINPNPIMENMSLEKMCELGAVFDMVFRPVLQAAAKQELEATN